MHDGAVKLREVLTNGHDIHVSIEPHSQEPGTLLDSQGHFVPHTNTTLMARLDGKMGQDVTLKSGTLVVIGLAFVLLNVIFSYGGSIIGWAKDDGTTKEQIQTIRGQVIETRNDVKSLNDKFDSIQKTLQEQAVQNAKGEGYKLGAIDGQTGHANVKK